MLLNFPEPRMEPFEEFQKIPTCPRCGAALEDGDHIIYDGDPHVFCSDDVEGCNHCHPNLRIIDDYNDILDILADE